jgi:DNA-binding SARP family transcriptional activator
MIDLRLLGALDVRADRPDGARRTLTQPKRLALLVYLALARPAGLHSRDELVALLWPEADAESARHSLRNGLHALRHVFGDDAIISHGESWVGLDFDGVRCDVLELRARLAAGAVDESIAFWRGELAPGFHVSGAPDFERWLDDQRAELLRSLRAAAWESARAASGSDEEVQRVRTALRLDPGNEPGVRRLMQLLAAHGDRGGALEAYAGLADHLARELETMPSESTIALAESIRSASGGERVRPPRAAAIKGDRDAPRAATREMSAAAESSRSWSGWQRGGVVVSAVALFAVLALAGRPALSRHGSPPVAAQGDAERAALRLPTRYRADSLAYRSYLRGLQLRFAFRFMASRDTLAALVEREPLYVPGLYGLAHAWIFTSLNGLTDPGESWPKVDALARRALALDSSAASAWLVLASEDMYHTGNLARARERIARARALDSLDPDVPGMLSVWFTFHQAMDSAVAEARVAHRLDPLSPLFARLVGKHLFFARRYDESLAVFEQMLTDDPGWTRGYEDLSELHRVMGRPRDAVTWLRRARAAAGDSAGAATLGDAATDSAATRLLDVDARRTIAMLQRSAREGGRAPAGAFARAYALLGDTLATLRWLDSMSRHRDSYLHQVRLDPRFDFLRADARYRAWEGRSLRPLLGEWTFTRN